MAQVSVLDEKVETIRTFNTNTQLSQELKNNATITPNIQNQSSKKNQISFWHETIQEYLCAEYILKNQECISVEAFTDISKKITFLVSYSHFG